MLGFNRRTFVGLSAAEIVLAGLGIPAQAQQRDAITIAFPIDVPSWDPHVEMTPTPQSLYRCVFEGPLTQAPDLSARPGLATSWRYRDATQLDLELTLRKNAYFHDGSRVTAEDIRYSFFERPKAPVAPGHPRLPYSFIWRKIKDIEIVSPSMVVFHFSEPMPTAVSWLYFLSSYVIPKRYVERVGMDAFAKAPVGSGPYKVVSYAPGSRIVLQGFDKYWGGKPPIDHVTIEIVKDTSARVAALESRRVDVATNLPYRDAVRIGAEPGMTANVFSTADFLFVAPTLKGAFAKTEVRLAAHHAIDKAALSRAFFGGKAELIDLPAAHKTPGYVEGYHFAYDPAKATALLKSAGYSPENPANINFSVETGVFPNDVELAQAIAAMWRKVGINATVDVITAVKFSDLMHANQLPEATLTQWFNSTGDPEVYGGYLFDPHGFFATVKTDELGKMVAPLLVETDIAKRYAGYRALHTFAVEQGYVMPLFQSVQAIANQSRVHFRQYENGWILPQAYTLQG
jgi:peptide/nickel transport system substrate-binding protein